LGFVSFAALFVLPHPLFRRLVPRHKAYLLIVEWGVEIKWKGITSIASVALEGSPGRGKIARVPRAIKAKEERFDRRECRGSRLAKSAGRNWECPRPFFP
jgi:hypothetical protein